MGLNTGLEQTGALETPARPHNNLLAVLRAPDYEMLRPHLRNWTAKQGEILYAPGDHVGTVYFPCGPSLVSYRLANEDGKDMELLLVGREGAVGGIVSGGHIPAYTKSVVQYEGDFVRLNINELAAAKLKSYSLRALFARYADCLLAQIFQEAACNAIHTAEQRTARWIASAIDRIGDDAVPLTQEHLSAMVGVGRSYISRVMRTFKEEDILKVMRGRVRVIDLEALKARSCRCDDPVKEHFDTILRGVYPEEGDA